MKTITIENRIYKISSIQFAELEEAMDFVYEYENVKKPLDATLLAAWKMIYKQRITNIITSRQSTKIDKSYFLL